MNKALIPLLALAAAAALPSAHAASGEELFQSRPCGACHNAEVRLVGPSLKEVAAKYAGEEGAVADMAASIKTGSSGKWGGMAMPPNAVNDDEARLLAEWILGQK